MDDVCGNDIETGLAGLCRFLHFYDLFLFFLLLWLYILLFVLSFFMRLVGTDPMRSQLITLRLI